MDRISEQDSNYYADYAYYAKQFWGEDQVGRPKFIIVRSDGVSADIYEIHDTFEEAEESLMGLSNKGYEMSNYSIHHISFPLPFNNKFIKYVSPLQCKELLKRINNNEKNHHDLGEGLPGQVLIQDDNGKLKWVYEKEAEKIREYAWQERQRMLRRIMTYDEKNN